MVYEIYIDSTVEKTQLIMLKRMLLSRTEAPSSKECESNSKILVGEEKPKRKPQ